MSALPSLFIERLRDILSQEKFESCLDTFNRPLPLIVRINTLKISKAQAEDLLRQQNIFFKEISWYQTALFLDMATQRWQTTEFNCNGYFYNQALSSLLPVIVLDPKPGEKILDMCAAPGSKTTQMAAHMDNDGEIVALEVIRERFYKLKSVLALMGAEIVWCQLIDARRFRPGGSAAVRQSYNTPLLFDRVLLDVPCSAEGRFKIHEPKSHAYWSLRKIKEMVRKQRGLLMTASRLVKPGGHMVYSTCTFAPEENEGIIDWFFKKTGSQFELLPVELPQIPSCPAITQWQGKDFHPDVKNCFRVLPNELMEGFFIAKLVRLN